MHLVASHPTDAAAVRGVPRVQAALLAELAAAGVSRAQIARHVGRADLRLGARIDAQIDSL